jgi:membrane-associated phospholipid phosphatase
VLVALSRVYLGVPYPFDVLAGLLIATAVVILAFV